MARATLCAVAYMLLAFSAAAYPLYWVDQNAADCMAHPTENEGLHGAPVVDKTTTFTVTEKGAAVTALCPGGTYDVVADFGATARRVLMTTSAGTLGRASSPCLNRAITLPTEQAEPTFKDVITIPCNTTDSEATIIISSATGKTAAFQTATVTLPINALAACPKSTCATAKAANATANATATAAANASALPGALPAAAAPANRSDAAASTDLPAAPAAAPARSSAGVASPVAGVLVLLSAVLALLGC